MKSQQQQQESDQDKNRWDDARQDSDPSAPDCGSVSPPAPIAKNEMEMEINRSETSCADASIGVHAQTDSIVNTEKEGNHILLSSTILLAKEQTAETEKSNLSQQLSSNAPEEERLAIVPSETKDRMGSSPATKGSPSDVVDSKAVSSAPSKSRLSLLLSLRPPPPKKSSILRRRCAPAKHGTVHDGTTREELSSNPTSDRHFDALAIFEALSSMPRTVTEIQKSASGDEVLVIDRETLHERLNLLFPKQFPHPSEKPTTKRWGNNSRPPCIFPRLVACYTIYRDYQRKEKTLQHQEQHAGSLSPTSSFSLPDGSECERSPKRRRIMDGMEQIDATLSTTCSEAVESLSLIRNLLQKFVDLEWTILEGHEHRNGDEGLSTSFEPVKPSVKATFASCWRSPKSKAHVGSPKRRRIQFAAFDDMAVVRAASDVLEDSQKPLENCTKALASLLNAVGEIFPKAISCTPTQLTQDIADQSPSSDATSIVCDFIFYLSKEFIPQCHDTICVESLMTIEKQNIPVLRVQKAATIYSRDLDSLINPKGKTTKHLLATTNAIEGQIRDDMIVVPFSISTSDVFVRTRPLTWECRLANTSAQLLRYWMRTHMNEFSERADSDTKTDQWKTRLIDCVNVTNIMDEKEFNIKPNKSITIYDESEPGRSISIEDDACSGEIEEDPNLSSMLSNALSHIYSYLNLGADQSALSEQFMSWKDRLLQEMPDENCCATTVCQDGFGTGRKPAYITEDDWQDIHEQLEAACYFCSFHRRALFIERLFSILELIGWTDQWTHTVQATARNLVKMKASINNSNNYAVSLGKPFSNLGNSDGDIKSNLGSIDSVAFGRAIQVEDEHLVLLGMPPNELVVRLRTEILPITCRRYEVCRANLRKMEKKFRLGKSNTAMKKKFLPNIGTLEAYWKEFLYEDTFFPSISFV